LVESYVVVKYLIQIIKIILQFIWFIKMLMLLLQSELQ